MCFVLPISIKKLHYDALSNTNVIVLIPKTLALLVLVAGVLNDQKTRTFTQYLSNAVVQNFNDFLNKRERDFDRRSRDMMESRFMSRSNI